MNKYWFIVLYSSNKYILYVNYNFMVKKLEHKQQKQYCNKFNEDLELKTKTKNYHRPSNPTTRHMPWGNQSWKKMHVPQCSLQHYFQ